MSTTYPPSREAELVTWSGNFGTKISATATAYGLTAAQASGFATLQTAFVDAYNVAQDDATRSPMNVELKNVAKVNLVANIRLLGGIVQRFPSTTNAMRIDLGLPQRGLEPSPIPPPAFSPALDVVSTVGRTVRIRIHGPDSTRRGKPPGVSGIAVFSHVGAEPPANIADWKFEGNTGRMTVEVVFDDSVVPGAKVWLTAFFFNPRKQSGAACDPISANLPGGSVSMAA